ncbi:glutamyl-tRNA(Gln) amidotransferase subunit C, chloroplastic/mitochondrial-like [Lycium barbarum]|uniref:glutamyl-tRNA(Gln) amidotransferase subunit C, chloroplastic/mitochondrial-like n=1 Tax=Lycium barbarum TaxID=112863 RepID=UPI00293F1C3C|nr:glutamyl-tRNA(Gln) amidotransferase subunit C, chloroplastic/mitochondrial-like [Lycium barbarum]
MACIKPLHLLKPARIATDSFFFNFTKNGISSFPLAIKPKHSTAQRSYYVKSSALEPPDIPRLAEKARISLTLQEVEEFAPKIRQVIDWFGQLQAVDLESIEPAIRADTEGDNLRDDIPEKFENREALISAVPSFEEPYIKVPKVLNKE